ncbi:hypothetical protein Taro_056485 [Colocasia esculenta]|uniref:Uncharacterized protein n=1 Tax=Colocasia esculenta TaxID=4460 RepID=A0A843XWM2_COLES|nr:hypothetical protein [Colocasia esculenta]
MSFRGRKTFILHSEITILADDLPYSKRLPRLRESLAKPTRGAAQSQRSEVVFNSTRDLLPSDSLDYANHWQSPHAEPPSHSDRKSCSSRREISSPGCGYGCPNIADITVERELVSRNSISGPKFAPGACVLVHRLPYPPVGRGYLLARGSEPPARPQFRIGTSTRSVKGHIQRFPVRRPNSSPEARLRAADAIAYGHPFAQTGITFHSVIRITYKTPIRNRHSEPLDGPLLPQRLPRLRESLAEPTHGAVPSQRSEVVFNSTRDLLPSSDSLDYANRWHRPHREPPSHSDRKSCLTRREISSSDVVSGSKNLRFALRNCDSSRRSPLFQDFFGSSDSLYYANRWRRPHVEPPNHSDRKSCSTRREISSPGRGYGCPNIADIVTPSGLFQPPQPKELGITFHTGIGIAYVTTIRNRHFETVDRALVSRNSVPGPKFAPRACVVVHRLP